MQKKSIILLFLISLKLYCFNQQIYKTGRYPNILFSGADFSSNVQIRAGDQGENHNVFFGNDNSILEFNGQSWSHIQLRKDKLSKTAYDKLNKSSVNKILTCSDGITYVARENSFGKLVKNKIGKTEYQTFLGNEISEINGVFNIIEINKQIYFISENSIILLKNNLPQIIKLPKNYKEYHINSCVLADENNFFLIVTNNNKNIYLKFDININKFEQINYIGEKGLESIRGSYFDNNNNLILISQENITFIYNPKTSVLNVNSYIQNIFNKLNIKNIKSFKKFNHQYLIGTQLDGLFVLDKNFNPIRQFSNLDGMENMEVNHFFIDNENNLWLCLDNGVHFFETSSPLTYYNKDYGISEYVCKINFDNQLPFIGLQSAGLLSKKSTYFKSKFENTNSINQTVWDIKTFETEFGKKTIIIADDGLYEFNPKTNKNTLIFKTYAWNIIQNPKNKNEFFIGGEGNFIKLELINPNKWKSIILKDDIEENVRSLQFFNDKIILGVENKGILIYDINKENFKDLFQNIVSNYRIEIFDNKIFVGMTTGLYYINHNLTQLLPFIEFNRKFIGDKNFAVFRLYNEKEKNRLWVITSNEDENSNSVFNCCWINKIDKKWEYTEWPLANLQYYKAEAIFDIQHRNNDETWIAGNKVIFILNEKNIKTVKNKFDVKVDAFKINNKVSSLLSSNNKFNEAFSYNNNSFYFSFHANNFSGIKRMLYRYKLENYNDWTDWSEMNFASLQKIPEGNYKLIIEAKNYYGFTSSPLIIDFTILPPWYRTWWAYISYTIIILILIYSAVQISIQRIKNQNIKLEEIVKERTHEIAEQNQMLEKQKIEIEQKSKDIVDSIVYAKRIQETILPNERMKEYFSNYFVFYRPKDIVSGDFYWARKKDNDIIFSVIDCTGHGVPGALVSIVGNAALLRCVNEHKLTEPSEILNKLREIVVKSFDKKGEIDVKDGMDMSLCSLNIDTLKLKHSGANNYCIIIRDKELIELKPDKQPIGYFANSKPFTQEEIQLQKGDSIYQFSDGYVDQFGGDKGKKLKSKAFKDFLIDISHLSMDKQYILIQDKFDTWKGDFDQVDDVCVLGIKL